MEKIISADSHVIEPHDLWQKRVSAKFRDRVPHLSREATTDRLVCSGMNLDMPVGLMAGVFRADKDVRLEGRWEEDAPKGGFEIGARMADMKKDGLLGEVVYPTVSMGIYGVKDVELLWELLHAYNSWLAEFCASSGGRIKGIGMIIPDDPAAALAEVKRCKELGLSGIQTSLDVDEVPLLLSKAFEPVWAACQDMNLPVHFHVATNRKGRLQFKHVADQLLFAEPMQHVLGYLIYSGLFDRFPRIKVVSGENNASWIGNFANKADYLFRRYIKIRADQILCKKKPSEYFADQIYLTFMDEKAAPLLAEEFPCNLMWGSDYPHNVSTWPNSVKIINDMFKGRSPEIREASLFGNAAKLYGFAL